MKLNPVRTRLAQPFSNFLSRHGSIRAAALVLFSGLGLRLALQLLGPAIFSNPKWAVYWPLDAITLAVLLMVPRSYWPWILLGAALNEVQASYQNEGAVEIAVDVASNLIEALIPAYLLPPFRNLSDWMQQPRLIARFIGFALLLAPLLGGVPVALVHHLIYKQNFWHQLSAWMFADALGMSLYLPLILALRSHETYDLFRWPQLCKTLGLLSITCGTSWIVFHQSFYPVAFIIMPTLLLIVFQLGFSGSTIAVNLLTVIVAEATLHGHGPFQLIPVQYAQYRIVTLQTFLTLSVLMSLPISILLLQRTCFEQQLKSAYLDMEALATQDGLTGIANRRRFDSAIDAERRRALRAGQSIGLLMVDVDYFKLYNDSYGHIAGDDCLRRVAEVLASVPLREGDLVARYGGEEFAILLPGADASGTQQIANLIRARIEAMGLVHKGGLGGVVTVSIGASTAVPESEWESSVLIHNADRALYAAKFQGRNCVQLWGSEVAEAVYAG